MRKVCPKCGRAYCELDNYCTKCGIAQEKEPNKCSEQRTTLCAHRVFADDDIYCPYCGALTTYAKERIRSSFPASTSARSCCMTGRFIAGFRALCPSSR